MLISDWSSDVCSSDLEAVLASLGEALVDSAQRKWTAGASAGDARPVRNPADQRDIVGHVTEVSEAAANDAMGRAQAAFEAWSAVPVAERASCLDRAADILQAQIDRKSTRLNSSH